LGIHVTYNHFYGPVPDTRVLKEDLWRIHSKLIGIQVNEKLQLDLLSRFKDDYIDEYEHFPKEKTNIPYEYYVRNRMFEAVDGEILYCMIRHFKPKRIIEIGSGYSTYLAAKAILKNMNSCDSYWCELTAIEPFPNKTLLNGFPGLSILLPNLVQDIPLSRFEELRENDMLLIDSSHVLKIGSDVQYEYLEILPRINKGVLISFHDIFLPAAYRKKWVLKDHLFWNEQYLLQAFLAFNPCFEVLWMGSYMHLRHPQELKAAFTSYDPELDWPGSFWICRIK
jgi:hypothetical protein